MTKARAFVLVLLCTLWPATARAQGGWWDYLEQLSGPGPFKNGPLVSLKVACMQSGRAGDHSATDAEWKYSYYGLSCTPLDGEEVASLEVRAGFASSDRQPLFEDRPNELVGKVTAHLIEVFLMRQFNDVFAAGGGVGWLWLSGDNVESTVGRLTFTPLSVGFSPLPLFTRAPWRKSVTVRFEEHALLKGFTASDFNPASTSPYSTDAELLRSLSITVDVFALVRR